MSDDLESRVLGVLLQMSLNHENPQAVQAIDAISAGRADLRWESSEAWPDDLVVVVYDGEVPLVTIHPASLE